MIHKATLIIDEGMVFLKVVCEYDPADTIRPCYPQPFEGEEPKDLTECVYAGWVEANGAELLTETIINGTVVCTEWNDGPVLEFTPEEAS